MPLAMQGMTFAIVCHITQANQIEHMNRLVPWQGLKLVELLAGWVDGTGWINRHGENLLG
jgi:hypothetical protein